MIQPISPPIPPLAAQFQGVFKAMPGAGAASSLAGILCLVPAYLIRTLLHKQILDERQEVFSTSWLSSFLVGKALVTISGYFGGSRELKLTAHYLDLSAAALRLYDQTCQVSSAAAHIFNTLLYGASFHSAIQKEFQASAIQTALTLSDFTAFGLACANFLLALGDLYYSGSHEENSELFLIQNITYFSWCLRKDKKRIVRLFDQMGVDYTSLLSKVEGGIHSFEEKKAGVEKIVSTAGWMLGQFFKAGNLRRVCAPRSSLSAT